MTKLPVRSETRRAVLVAGLLGLFVLLWSVAEWLPTLLTPGYSLYQVVWMRYGTHILVMLLALAPRHGRALFRTQRLGLQLGRGLLMLVMPASYILSLDRARGGDVMAVFWLVPILILVFAALVQGDRARWPLWGAAAATTLGAQLILRPTTSGAAAIFGLGMALSFSLYVVLTRSLRDEPTMVNLFYSAVAVFVPLTLAMPAVWQPLTARDAIVMAGVGLVGLVVLWALDKACELVSATVFGPLFALQLLLALLLSPLLGGPQAGRLALVGAALIAGAAIVALRSTADKQTASREPREARLEVETL